MRVADLIAAGEEGLAAVQTYLSEAGAGLERDAALELAEACEEIGNRYVDVCEELLGRVFPSETVREAAEVAKRITGRTGA